MESDDDYCDDFDACIEYEDEDGDQVELEKIETGPDKDSEDKYPYEVLSTDKIVKDMLESIKSIGAIIEIPATTTRILLHHFKWDREKLLDKFYSGNRSQLFKDAHVVDPATESSLPEAVGELAVVDTEEDCAICFMPLARNLMTGLKCGHRFCGDCWDEYLTTKIMEEGECQTISCPAHKCDILVDDKTVMRLIKISEVKVKYEYLITNSFVQFNRMLKWCPSPGCNNAIKVQYSDFKLVKCSCGYTFCFKCTSKWHEPVNCELLEKWMSRVDEDSATSAWIGLNTKDCPSCATPIEKNGGCNWMYCSKCKFGFCWMCLKKTEDHFCKCNRFQDRAEDASRDPKKENKSALRKYLHYSDRYMNHANSLKLESNLYDAVKEKMYEMQRMTNLTWAEVLFLKNAVDTLCRCRTTLMYTYAFAYFIVKNNQFNIFEDNQEDLERATESLSQFLEQDLKNEDLGEIKQKVMNKSSYCENRRKALVDHVYEGYERDWWFYLNMH
uniref:RBR-type E3 ubiquitin transferase n=1 Tax=Glyptapanteles indiensis TaxID=92994 RepID=B7S8Y5_GLYIN|nr:ariadne [Glyptapanteles indiensis]